MNTVKSFVKQFTAFIKGDDAEAQAQKVLRQADSALKSQIASLNGDTITYEDAVTAAEEKEGLAIINNGKPITDRSYYVSGLLNAKNQVTSAQEALKTHLEKIAFLQSKLDGLGEEEAAA
jgi:hypothetical protein